MMECYGDECGLWCGEDEFVMPKTEDNGCVIDDRTAAKVYNQYVWRSPKKAFYIKLGGGGKWESDCIERDQAIRLSYREIPHDLCLQGKWDEVYRKLEELRLNSGAARRDANQIRLFYESDESVLWVTFYGDLLDWCFSRPEVTLLSDGSKTRPVIDQWYCRDVNDKLLYKNQLNGRLLSMESFRGTICSVKEFDYLVRKIGGHLPKEVEEAQAALSKLEGRIETVIRKLHWRDFEILIDLIFARSGWQRVNELGGIQKTLDLDLISPITSERYGVQVKSKADLAEFEDYQQRFGEMQGYTRLYFVVHTPLGDFTNAEADDNIVLWLPGDIAHWAVKYGLADWIITKAS
jgi:hypothetical protein